MVSPSSRPLVLLDVDGVLNPTSAGPPPGYERRRVGEYEVMVSSRHRGWLAELEAVADLAWASTWQDKANESIGPLLGLPRLEVVEFGVHDGDTWKLAGVRRFVGDRSLVWIDDQLFDDARAWASQRSVPTLLVRPASSVGLVEREMNTIRDFLGSLEEGNGPSRGCGWSGSRGGPAAGGSEGGGEAAGSP